MSAVPCAWTRWDNAARPLAHHVILPFVISFFVILAQLRRVLELNTWREVVSAVPYAWTRWDQTARPLAHPVATSSAGPVSLVGKNCQLYIKLVRPVLQIHEILVRILLFSSLIFRTSSFFAYYFLKVHLHHFSKINSYKRSQNSRNQCFAYIFA